MFQIKKMKVRIYKPKKFNRRPRRINPVAIPYNVKEISLRYDLICEYEEKLIVSTAIAYINQIDNGPFLEIACPHMLKPSKGMIEMYNSDIIEIEYKDKSEYWMATVDSWHKIN